MMKYTFENVKPDVYVLKYKNKDGKEVDREFTRNIKLARTLQRVNALAKVEMVSMLKEQGLTKDDLKRYGILNEEGNFSFAGEVYNSYRMWVEVLELGYIAW